MERFEPAQLVSVYPKSENSLAAYLGRAVLESIQDLFTCRGNAVTQMLKISY
jgi:hypothetical protein